MANFRILVLAILLACISYASAQTSSQTKKCVSKNKYVYNAINNFCSKRNIVVPSDYAMVGRTSKPANARVTINGNCNPPQWVPTAICRAQFIDMCAWTTDHFGQNTGEYGRNKCQKWQIFSTFRG